MKKSISELENRPNRTPEEDEELEKNKNRLRDLVDDEPEKPENNFPATSNPPNYAPWIIGGCLLIFLILLIFFIFRKRKKH